MDHVPYYQPYDDDGWWNQNLSKLLGGVGKDVGKVVASDLGVPPVFGQVAGGLYGKLLGSEIGWAVDNAAAIEHNIGAAMEEMNQPEFWMPPSPFDE